MNYDDYVVLCLCFRFCLLVLLLCTEVRMRKAGSMGVAQLLLASSKGRICLALLDRLEGIWDAVYLVVIVVIGRTESH